MENKIALLIHPEYYEQLKESISDFKTQELSWILSTMNGFNKNGEDYRITKMTLDKKEEVINLSAENSSKDVKGISLITEKK
jgi:hypothetical protein